MHTKTYIQPVEMPAEVAAQSLEDRFVDRAERLFSGLPQWYAIPAYIAIIASIGLLFQLLSRSLPN